MDTSADNIYRNEPIGRPNDKVNQDKLADNFVIAMTGSAIKLLIIAVIQINTDLPDCLAKWNDALSRMLLWKRLIRIRENTELVM